MKDEYGGKSILKFLGLMYSTLDESSNEKSRSKSHNACIEFQEFHDTLFQKMILRHQMRGIKSKDHNRATLKTNKKSLQCFDDKRYFSEMESKYLHMDIKTIKMINLDSITNENNKKQSKMAIYSRPSVQNFDNWWFWIRKNKHIT